MKNRRDFLRMSGLVGAAALLPFGKLIATDLSTCVLMPNETEGPYPYPGGELGNPLNQADVRGGQIGAKIDYTFTVVDQATCMPLPNVRVDIWHCNANGDYSGYGNFPNEYWCRGWQMTDANGIARFTSIYPGWYNGRATHVHIELFYNNVMKKTSQFAFDESISNTVHLSSQYTGMINTTTNMQDGILGNSAADLATEMVNINGNLTNGFTGDMTIAISGVPLGVSEINSEKLSVYPSPVKDKLIVHHPLADSFTTAKVIDLNGKVIAKTLLKNGTTATSIDASMIPNGVYILVIENAGKKNVIKFVKV
jgi:protocatechuate 3,4-dioxygenase beta subunit